MKTLKLFSCLTIMMVSIAPLNGQSIKPLKQVWFSTVGTDLSGESAFRVVLGPQGEAYFAGNGACNVQDQQSGGICSEQVEIAFNVLEGVAAGAHGNSSGLFQPLGSEIMGQASIQGVVSPLPLWLRSCDSTDGASRGVVVTDDGSKVYLAGTCRLNDFTDFGNAFLREFATPLNGVNETFELTIGGQQQGRALGIEHRNGPDWVYMAGVNLASGNAYILRHVEGANVLEQRLEFGSGGFDVADDIFVDTNGDIYVSGSTDGNFAAGANNDGIDDVFVIKFEHDGANFVELWRKQISLDDVIPNNSDSPKVRANAVVVDNNGMVFVGGSIRTDSMQNGETEVAGVPFLFKFDQNNLMDEPFSYIERDATSDHPSIDFFDYPGAARQINSHLEDLVLDQNGDVLAIGRTTTDYDLPTARDRAAIFRFDNLEVGFDLAWEHEIDQEGSGFGITFDSNTKSIVACGVTTETGNSQAFVARYVLIGDLNCDGKVTLLDISPFVNLLNSGVYVPAADINCDGVLSLLDVQPFINLIESLN